MTRKGRKALWITVAGVSAIALAVLLPLTVSKVVIGPAGIQYAVSPTPPAQAPPLARLDAIATAVGDQGEHGPFADAYSSLYMDVPHGCVVVYVTSLVRGQAMLQAAHMAHPGIDLSRVKLERARYSKRTLDKAMGRLLSQRAPAGPGVKLDGVGLAIDGSGLRASVEIAGGNPVTLATVNARLTRAAGGIPVRAIFGSPLMS